MAKRISVEQLIILHNQLEHAFSQRSPERTKLVEEFAQSFGVTLKAQSTASYASVSNLVRISRKDFNQPRAISSDDMLMYCRLIAALKIRTSNKNNRHLSTPNCIEILEQHGVETVDGLVKAPLGVLKKATVNRYITQWGFAHHSMLSVEPVVVHFEAEESNDCWQFDFSPSDLKQLTKNSENKLFIVSVTDDKSGVLYSEYIEAMGEDALTALKFLFRAMSAKKIKGFPFQGIPRMIYTDNGAFARSAIFNRVLAALGIELKTHLPQGKDGRRTTAESKGKTERTNRSAKEMFEPLFHLHEPTSLEQLNEWAANYLKQSNEMSHRSEDCGRLEAWKRFLPQEGYRKMCFSERVWDWLVNQNPDKLALMLV